MNHQVRNLVIGLAVLVAGVVGLFLPVSVWDGQSTVGCGNAVVADQSSARAASENTGDVQFLDQVVAHPDYAALCDSAISGRRHWAIPLVIVGAVGVLVGLLFRRRPRARS